MSPLYAVAVVPECANSDLPRSGYGEGQRSLAGCIWGHAVWLQSISLQHGCTLLQGSAQGHAEFKGILRYGHHPVRCKPIWDSQHAPRCFVATLHMRQVDSNQSTHETSRAFSQSIRSEAVAVIGGRSLPLSPSSDRHAHKAVMCLLT